MSGSLWQEVQELNRAGLSARAIGRQLGLGRKRVRSLLAGPTSVARRTPMPRPSKLAPHQAWIAAMLERYPEVTAQRLFVRLRDERNFTGGSSIVRDYVAKLRTAKPKRAFFTQVFAPGEMAQVDWGEWRTVDVEGTVRKLYFFVMVLGHSRMLYAELSLGMAMEHWLACHRNAFEFFGGVPQKVRVDRCKTAVCGQTTDGKPIITAQYASFAKYYDFKVDACNKHRPNEKGTVENGVGYLKSAFFAGREPTPYPALQAALRDWMDREANPRLHGTLHKRPVDLFTSEERPKLKPLPLLPEDCYVEVQASVDSRFRVELDTNRYSVPAEFASRRVILRRYAERILVLSPSERRVLAVHSRRYGRHQDILIPEHERSLILATRHAREKRMLETFLSLGASTERYLSELQQRRPDWHGHLRRINALALQHDRDEIARVIADALEHQAIGADYIENILAFRSRIRPAAPGPLHVTRRQDLLELSLPEPDLDVYNTPEH